MVEVQFLGPIGLDSMNLEVKNLNELKEKLRAIEALKTWLPLCAVALNDEIITDKNVIFKDNDRICLLPPVCGG